MRWSILLAFLISAETGSAASTHWFERAESLGLRNGHVDIEYSLTDECELGPVRVRNVSSTAYFDDKTVARIVAELIGPFQVANANLIDKAQHGDKKHRSLSMTKRRFSWTTNNGYAHIECVFYADGDLASVTLVGVENRSIKSQADRPIAVRLSTLGKSIRKFSFRFER